MSVDLPWWSQSPSPYTLVYWAVLGLYGAHQFRSKTPKQWIKRMIVGTMLFFLYVLLPIDMVWQSFQWIRFGNLYPDEWVLVVSVFARDLAGMFLCLYFSALYAKKEHIILPSYKGMMNLLWIVPFMVVWFMLAPDPSWTDWTYGIRFGYEWRQIWQSFFISHVLLKLLMGYVYIRLWK